MLGVSGLLGSSGDGAASAVVATSSGPPEGGGGLELGGGGSNSGGFSEDDKAAPTRGEEGDRSSAGNRWPRQETLALLKIRSDMDVTFKDSSLKGPLWEEVSRKLAELGYQRSAKKCKEKFENVYKYHKRTKEGRATKPDAKTYRFFEQLEALDTHPIHNIPPPLPPPALPPPPPLHQQLHHHHHQKSQPPPAASAAAAAQPPPPMLPAATAPQPLQQITVPSPTATNPAANNSTAASQNTSAPAPTTLSTINPSPLPPQAALQHPRNPTNIPQPTSMMNPSSQSQSQPHSFRNLHASNSTSSSSSTSSDETLDGNDGGGRKRKRKWKDFFERLMRDVIKKQEELQKRFLEAIEKRERDRLVREEAWRMQEMTRMNREHEILVKERSIAAAKDAALIAFLQKMSSDPHNPVPIPPVPEDAAAVALQVVSPPPPQPSTQAQAQSQPQTPVAAAQQPQQQQQATPTSPSNFGSIVRVNNNSMVAVGMGGGLEVANVTSPASTSSSRWPKTEVQALIKLRTDLDVKYQESGPKGPLWEEISAGMRQLGYTRNAKRCKEKWENINKYFKKVKESNKKRPEDSKTCPYFHQLDALYREKTLMLRADVGGSSSNPPNPNYVPMLKPPAVVPVAQQPTPTPTALPMMVRPEQQWPPLHPEDQRVPPEDIGSENMEEPNPDDDMDDDGDVGDDDDEEEEEDDEGGGYEIVTNKQKPDAGDS